MGVVEEANSDVNGKVVVLHDISLGTYIQVDGLTQSGSIVNNIWKNTLTSLKESKPVINKCLILGLGGGTAAKVVRKLWNDAKITGVDLDPVIVELGKKHMGLEKLKVDIQIEDADRFVDRALGSVKTYDLILVDVYIGRIIPDKFNHIFFIRRVKNLLAKNGTVVFNRLNNHETKRKAGEFTTLLKKIYSKIDTFYPEANIVYIAQK